MVSIVSETWAKNMKLHIPKRVLPDQKQLTNILEACRAENNCAQLTNSDLKQLAQLNLRNICYNSNDRQKLRENALALFATQEPHDEHNEQKLIVISTTKKFPWHL